ncbi:hypothetical protein SO802_022792 [Lithocarpus litseifolius]|uniref:ADP-ribosyl cyclase/cyclic ADP-ribose hydrolase n=1 Tax=Lithocarpus litseifolius TaxID=425828 RepID=A0AAW2C7I7_9ROSI
MLRMASIRNPGILSSSSTSSSRRWVYDVFLSFRGMDTRNNFISHLYFALKQKGIFTFKDNEGLERGEFISPELLKAIEESKFAIVILSRNYASSTWCLDELAKIVECMKQMKMTVIPIFYDVNPSDVRKQMGTFAQAFAKHEKCFKKNIKKVQTWRDALREVANLYGWHLQDRPEAEFIQDIVKVIVDKLSSTFSIDTKSLPGIDFRVEKLKSHLVLESNDVRIIGIWGMGGMGKTTLARVVYDMVSNQFEACSFIANVREVYEKYGLLQLQQTLMNGLLMDKDMVVQDVDTGVFMIQNRLRHKKVLLILDDVNELDQIKKLAGENDWFGLGSRVIITTRDKHLLVSRKVDGIYEVEGLNCDEALHLFNMKAFGKEHPTKDYLELSKAFVRYANGLPLAIEILGSFLFNRSIAEWESELDRLKEFSEQTILSVLQISYDGLRDTEKEIFLNIACFFCDKDQDRVMEILNYLELYPKIGLRILIDKSLVKLQHNQLWMHDLLQEMGRHKVHQESPKDPGKRSRLWLYKDINNVLTRNTGTAAIQSIVLKLPKPKEAHWNLESFLKMHCLKFLIIDNVHLMHDPKHLPSDLIFLQWNWYPSKYFPSSLQAKTFESLKVIKLNKSLQLIEAPDLTKIPILEKLVLKYCLKLCELHPSVRVHKKLTLLNLKGCKNLRSLPRKFEMESLEILILSNCSKVKRIPEFGENMERVSKLYLDGTAISKLPTSIENLTGLASLDVGDCKNLMSLPSTFFNLKLTKDLNLSGCSKLLENLGITKSVVELDTQPLPSSNALFKTLKNLAFGGFKLLPFYSMPRNLDFMGLLSTSLLAMSSLTCLNLSYCNLNAIPNDICRLSSLQFLWLSGNHFVCLPESISQLSVLHMLVVEHCTSLRAFPKLPSSIDYIYGNGCTSLETIPDLLRPNSFRDRQLWISDSSKLADNEGLIDIFFAVIKKHSQGFDPFIYDIIIPGSEIPEWFSHQSMGPEVKLNIKKPYSNCWNEWMGISICVAFCPHPCHNKDSLHWLLIANGKEISSLPGTATIVVLSDNILLQYLSQSFKDNEEGLNVFRECYENGFSQIGLRIETGFKVKKCGFRMVYKRDTEDLNRFMAQRGNNDITPYEGINVQEDSFGHSAVVAEGNKAKRSCDNYDGAGPSGEGSSNDIPNPKRIKRLT